VGVVNGGRRGRRESQVFVVVVVVVMAFFDVVVRGLFQVRAERLRKSGTTSKDAAQPTAKKEREKIEKIGLRGP